jgi:arylsulfatase B
VGQASKEACGGPQSAVTPVHRRDFLLGAGAATLAAAIPAIPQTRQPRRPNVILLMTDDQGYGDLACHGNPVIRTPNLDALHARSVRFTNFHVSPTCSPTRSALLTGRYTNATGAWHTIQGRSLLRRGEVTIADCFRNSGYRTGIFGKWHLGDNFPCRPQDRGFGETLVHGGGGIWQTPDHFGNDYADDIYLHNGRPKTYKGFCTDVWFENAMRFIDESVNAREQFFCYIATNAPHGPMWSPESYEAPYRGVKGLREPGFYGMITNIDDNFGRLAKFLRDRRLEDNTLLIYMTDNGTASGAQVFNAGMRGQKGSPYEGGHRVPFFVHWPEGGLTGGRDVKQLAAHIDVAPTLIDYCRLSRPQGPPMHGRSLRSLLTGQPDDAAAWPDRTIVTDSQRVEKLVKWRQAAVMSLRWRLVNPSPDGDPSKLELFDMHADPGQKTNVAAAHPDVVAKLKGEYDKWWTDVSKNSNEPVRIVLGSEHENPTRLTCHDWHGEGVEKVWNQRGIRQAPTANGYWTVEIDRPGRYRIGLRRWPPELDLPINAAYTDAVPNREPAPGRAISAAKARVKLGHVDQSAEVKDSDKAAVFEVNLTAGPGELHTWFYDAGGTELCGAYFVTVERLA